MRKMKKWLSLLLLATVVLAMAACGTATKEENKNGENEKTVSVETIMNDIKSQIAKDYEESGAENVLVENKLQGFVEANLVAEESEDPANAVFVEKLKINKEDLESGVVLAPLMNTKSDEIIVLKAKDEKQVKALQGLLDKEKEAQISTWETYLPDQLEKVQNNIIKTNGKYLLYVTYDDPSKIEAIFDKHTK